VTVSISAPRAGASADVSAPLFTMSIALDAVGSPLFVRDEANAPTSSSSGGTAAASIVDVAAAPELAQKALRLAVTSGRGGWAFPIELGAVELPAEGFVLEIDFSNIDASNLGGFVMPMAEIVGATVEGIAAPLFSGVSNMAAEVRIMSSAHARVLGLTASATTWPSSPTAFRATRGPHRQRVTVRRTHGTDPLAWTMTSRTESPGGSYVHSAAWSGAYDTIAPFASRTFDRLALVVWVPSGYGPADAFFDVQALRVLPLP
jgi:hypothetical protein